MYGSRYPEAWSQISTKRSGQFQDRDGLFTFATIYPERMALSAVHPIPGEPALLAQRGRFWKIISRVSSRELTSTPLFFIQKHLTLYLAMFSLLTLGSWFLAHSRYRHHLAETQRDYERRFRHTLENIDLAAVALNRQEVVTFYNDYFLKLSGWKRAEVIGNTGWINSYHQHTGPGWNG